MRVARWLFFTGVFVLVLFGLAGRWDLPWLWTYTGVGSLASLAIGLTMDPELARERLHPAPGGVDRYRRIPFGLLFLSQLFIGVLDVGRFHWSDSVPLGARSIGLIGYAAGLGVLAWTIALNPFFSPVVRVQSERGHRLVSGGPYSVVRHPGYAAIMVAIPCGALAIGSWWAFGLALLFDILVLGRVRIEDPYLHEHFAGYREYAARVRYRLIPGVW